MKNWLVIALLFSIGVSFGQSEEVRNKVLQQCESLSSKYGELNKTEKNYFSDIVTAHYIGLEKNHSLDHQDKFETYLLDVFKQIRPDVSSLPKVSLYRSGYPNAFTVFFGDMQFHWGILAELESEASLAFLMGHEYAHYEQSHLYQTYVGRDINKDSDRESVIKYYHNEQMQEYESDSLGFEWGVKAGYDWVHGLSDFNEFLSLDTIFSLMEKKAEIYGKDGKKIKIENNESDSLFITHPTTLSRINKWKYWGSKVSQKGVSAKVSSSYFKELQNYSRTKTLEHFLKTQNFKLGLCKAFKYYCLDNKNPIYQYYLYEFIRRKIENNNRLKGEVFMADVFVSKGKQGVYKNLKWLFRKENQLRKIKKSIVPSLTRIDSTYASVVKHLENLVSTNSYGEMYLSLALYNRKNDSLRNIYIDKYLSQESKLFPEYAQALKDNKLNSKLRSLSKKIVYLQGLTSIYKDDYGIASNPLKSDKKFKNIVPKLNVFLENKLENKGYIFAEKGGGDINWKEFDLIIRNFIRMELYKEGSTDGGFFVGGNKNNFLVPEVWTFLYRNGISSVSEISVYDIIDKTVGHAESTSTIVGSSIQSIHPATAMTMGNVGRVRFLYVVSINELFSEGLSVTEEEILVRGKLTDNLILTEAYQLLK